MAYDNLFISDDEYISHAPEYKNIIEEIKEVYSKYIAEVEKIGNEKYLQGSANDNLQSFIMLAKPLSYQLTLVIKQQCEAMKNYISAMDKADDFLY